MDITAVTVVYNTVSRDYTNLTQEQKQFLAGMIMHDSATPDVEIPALGGYDALWLRDVTSIAFTFTT